LPQYQPTRCPLAQLKAVSTRHKADLGYALAITSSSYLDTGGAESSIVARVEVRSAHPNCRQRDYNRKPRQHSLITNMECFDRLTNMIALSSNVALT
jgi:hypothetical protein